MAGLRPWQTEPVKPGLSFKEDSWHSKIAWTRTVLKIR